MLKYSVKIVYINIGTNSKNVLIYLFKYFLLSQHLFYYLNKKFQLQHSEWYIFLWYL